MQRFRKFAVTLITLSGLGIFIPGPAAAEVCDEAYGDCLINAIWTGGTVVEIGDKAVGCTSIYVRCLGHSIMKT